MKPLKAFFGSKALGLVFLAAYLRGKLAPSAFSDCVGAAASPVYKPENTTAFRQSHAKGLKGLLP